MPPPEPPQGVGKTALGVARVRALESQRENRLTAAGFGPAEPATRLAEGLIIYLTAGEAGRLFSMVGDLSVPGGRLAFEHDPAGLDTMTARARQIPAMRTYTSLWKGGLGDPPRWLADHGWRPEFHGLAALGRSYRRPVPDAARSGFLTAVRVATVAREVRGRSRDEPGGLGRRRGLPSAEPLPGREVIAGVEVDH